MVIAVDDTLAFVRRCLEMAGKLLATGGAFLWKFNSRKNKLGLTAEWVAAGRPSRKEQLRTIAGDVLAESLGCLMNGDILNITDVSTLPAGHERELAEGLRRRAVLVAPLFSRETFFGFVGAFPRHRRRGKNPPSADVCVRLRLITKQDLIPIPSSPPTRTT